jgi:hypothetical protein
VRLHFYVSKQLAERVEHVGAMLGHPKARAAAFLLDNASQLEGEAIAAIDRRIAMAAMINARMAATGIRAQAEPSDEIVLMYVRLESGVAARIERLAKKRKLSVSRVCAWLLSRAADDDKWIVSIVQARLSEALARPSQNGSTRKRRNHEPRTGRYASDSA